MYPAAIGSWLRWLPQDARTRPVPARLFGLQSLAHWPRGSGPVSAVRARHPQQQAAAGRADRAAAVPAGRCHHQSDADQGPAARGPRGHDRVLFDEGAAGIWTAMCGN